MIWIVENTVIAAGLAGVVAFVCRFNQRRPALGHFLWLLVLVVLVTPPLPRATDPGLRLRGAIRTWLDALGPRAVASNVAVGDSTERLGDEMFATTTAASSRPRSTSAWTAPTADEAGSLGPLALGALALWAAGASWMLVREGRRIARFARRVRAAEAPDPDLVRAIDDVATTLGVRRPAVRVIDGVGSPSVWCLGTPVLLWPRQRAQRPTQPALIAHELAHLARRDHWVARLELACRLLYFWHPLFWLVRRRVHEYAELSCDAWALWAYPAERRAFAGALIDVQADVARAPIALQGLCATTTEIRNFERRLSMIMKARTTRTVPKSIVACALAATAFVLPGYGGEQPDELPARRTTAAELVRTKKLAHEAEEAFQAKAWEEAVARFEEVLEADPRHGQALARLGTMLVGMGELEKARAVFERQMEVGHEVSTAAYNLACTASLAGDTPRAEKRLKQAIRLGFANSALMASDPDLEAIQGSATHEECIAAAERIALLKKKLAWAEQHDAKKAAVVHAALAEIVCDDGEVLDAHGLALLSRGELDAAAQAFQHQAEVGYDVARAHYNLACALARAGDRDGALKNLKRSAELGMVHEAVFQDGDLESLHGHELFETLAHELAGPAAAKAKIEAAIADERHAEAVALLEGALAEGRLSAKGRSWVRFELGKAQQALGRTKAALESYERALAGDFRVGDVTFHIAQALAAAGNRAAAVDHLEHAVTLGFDDAAAVKTCGAAFELPADRVADLARRAARTAEKAYEKEKAWKEKAWKEKAAPEAEERDGAQADRAR